MKKDPALKHSILRTVSRAHTLTFLEYAVKVISSFFFTKILLNIYYLFEVPRNKNFHSQFLTSVFLQKLSTRKKFLFIRRIKIRE